MVLLLCIIFGIKHLSISIHSKQAIIWNLVWYCSTRWIVSVYPNNSWTDCPNLLSFFVLFNSIDKDTEQNITKRTFHHAQPWKLLQLLGNSSYIWCSQILLKLMNYLASCIYVQLNSLLNSCSLLSSILSTRDLVQFTVDSLVTNSEGMTLPHNHTEN